MAGHIGTRTKKMGEKLYERLWEKGVFIKTHRAGIDAFDGFSSLIWQIEPLYTINCQR